MTSPGDPFGLIGATLDGKYRVDRLLGEGGFGVVYAGFHLLIGQPVAIKCMKPSGAEAEQQRMIELFLREARLLFSITHPNIVRLYDVGTLPMRAPLPSGAWAPRVPYVVLELIDGRSLQEEISDRRARGGPHFTSHELSSLFRQVLEGVAHAHEQGIVHRDLKPSNVMMIGSGASWTIKVVDFGIARVAASAETTTGAPFTPLYAAPEQWDASLGPIGPPTDIFAIGLMAMEACTLTRALPSDSLAQVVGAVMDPTKRPRVTLVRPDLGPGIDDALGWATRVQPADRTPSARLLQQSLASALGASGSRGTQPVPVAPSVQPAAVPSAPYQQPPYAMSGPMTPSTVAMTNPAASQTPPSQIATVVSQPKPGMSVGKIILAVTGIVSLTLLAGLTIIVFFSYKACVDQPWIQQSTPVVAGPAGSVAAKPVPPTKGWMFLKTIQPGHFYTEGQLRPVVAPEVAGFERCYLETIPEGKRFDGEVFLTVDPTEQGGVSSVMCSVIVGAENAHEEEMCSCITGKASMMSVPKPTGRLGLLRSGPFIVTLKTRKKKQ